MEVTACTHPCTVRVHARAIYWIDYACCPYII